MTNDQPAPKKIREKESHWRGRRGETMDQWERSALYELENGLRVFKTPESDKCWRRFDPQTHKWTGGFFPTRREACDMNNEGYSLIRCRKLMGK